MNLNIGSIPRIEEREFRKASAFRVRVGTNGLQGGDAGHGSVTFLEISEDGAAVEPEVDGTTIRITLGGDSELETFIEALEYAASELRRQASLGDTPSVPGNVAAEIEVVRSDLRELANARWDLRENKAGAARLKECASRVVSAAERVNSRVRESCFPNA